MSLRGSGAGSTTNAPILYIVAGDLSLCRRLTTHQQILERLYTMRNNPRHKATVGYDHERVHAQLGVLAKHETCGGIAAASVWSGSAI